MTESNQPGNFTPVDLNPVTKKTFKLSPITLILGVFILGGVVVIIISLIYLLKPTSTTKKAASTSVKTVTIATPTQGVTIVPTEEAFFADSNTITPTTSALEISPSEAVPNPTSELSPTAAQLAMADSSANIEATVAPSPTTEPTAVAEVTPTPTEIILAVAFSPTPVSEYNSSTATASVTPVIEVPSAGSPPWILLLIPLVLVALGFLL